MYVIPTGNDIKRITDKIIRTRSPWWKFKPFVCRNDEGKQWEVYFKDDIANHRNVMIRASAGINDDGEIVSLTIYDENLKARNSQS